MKRRGMKKVSPERIPISKLVEENVDSMASARFQADILQKYNEWEAIEDELKEYVRRWALSSSSPYREAFQHIIETIERIDKAQDELIEAIFYYAQHIYKINWLSNQLLKRFDIRSRRNGKHEAPLFKEFLKEVTGGEL